LVEVLQDREHKDLVRKLPRIIESFQNALQERDEGLRQLGGLRERSSRDAMAGTGRAAVSNSEPAKALDG